jgi:hypothetical protein
VSDALLCRGRATVNPLWLLEPSADGARDLLQAFQKIDPETGELAHDFTDPTGAPASSATSTKTSPTTPRSSTPCSRPRSSSRSSSSTAPSTRRHRHLRPGRHRPHRPHLRQRPLPARRVPPAVRAMGGERRARNQPTSNSPERALDARSPVSTSTRSPPPSPASASWSPRSRAAVIKSLGRRPRLHHQRRGRRLPAARPQGQLDRHRKADDVAA